MLRRGSTKHIERNYEAGRLEEQVQQLEETTLNGEFQDSEFPPNVSSLINVREVPPFVVDVHKFSRQTAWRRAPDICRDNRDPDAPAPAPTNKQKLMTLDNIHPTAVKQGELENCYFLASLTSLSLYPDRILRLFLPQCNDDLGVYAVRLFCNGAPKEVLVDNWLPIEKQTNELPKPTTLPKGAKITNKNKQDNGDGTSTVTMEILFPDGRLQVKKQTIDNDAVNTKLKFSTTTTDELWVPIIEKAYAKIQGSYAALEAGCHYETIRDLTGAPGFYWMTVEEPHWNMIQDFYQQRFPMSCGIDYKYGMPWTAQDLQTAGLVPVHVYSILAACTVHVNGQPHRLIKLRNPWGDAMEWTGNWGNRSPLWTSNVRDQIRLMAIPLEDPAANDGIFWMAFEDFSRYFNSWDVSKYHDPHQFSAAILQDNPCGFHLVTVHVQQQGQYTFGISQCSSRMMPTSAKYKYSSVRAIIVKAADTNNDNETSQLNGCQFSKGVVGENRDEYIELDSIDPGMYYLLVQVWWDPSSRHLPHKEISVNCYGTARVKFDQDLAPAYDIEKVLTEIFAAKVKKSAVLGSTDHLVSRTRGRPEAQNIQEHFNRESCPEGYQFHLFCNMESENVQLQEDKKFLSLKNAEIVTPTKKSPDYKITGKDGYSVRVKQGEIKGVFVKVKSTFGMAGPTGKATIIMSDGSSIVERENDQSLTKQPNLPENTGIAPTSVPPIALETLYAGGSKGGRMTRKSSMLGSILSGFQGSTMAPSSGVDVRKSKRTAENDASESKPWKARNFFRGWMKKGPDKNHEEMGAVSMVDPDIPSSSTSPVLESVHRESPHQTQEIGTLPSPEMSSPPPSQQQVIALSAAATQPPAELQNSSSTNPTDGKTSQERVAHGTPHDLDMGDERERHPQSNVHRLATLYGGSAHDSRRSMENSSQGPKEENPPLGAGESHHGDNPAPTRTNTADAPPLTPTTAGASAKNEPNHDVKHPYSLANQSSGGNEGKTAKPGFFQKLFGKARRKGRNPTPEEKKILSKHPELKRATVLEHTKTVISTKRGDQVVSTKTVTILRLKTI